jgi:hypothetical protein
MAYKQKLPKAKEKKNYVVETKDEAFTNRVKTLKSYGQNLSEEEKDDLWNNLYYDEKAKEWQVI